MNSTKFSLSARRTGRIVVGVSGSPGSLAALTRAVQEARRRGQTLMPVIAWAPAGGEMARVRRKLRDLTAGDFRSTPANRQPC